MTEDNAKLDADFSACMDAYKNVCEKGGSRDEARAAQQAEFERRFPPYDAQAHMEGCRCPECDPDQEEEDSILAAETEEWEQRRTIMEGNSSVFEPRHE